MFTARYGQIPYIKQIRLSYLEVKRFISCSKTACEAKPRKRKLFYFTSCGAHGGAVDMCWLKTKKMYETLS